MIIYEIMTMIATVCLPGREKDIPNSPKLCRETVAHCMGINLKKGTIDKALLNPSPETTAKVLDCIDRHGNS